MFAKKHKVILPDHRGTGRSTHTAKGQTITQHAADFAAIIEKLGVVPMAGMEFEWFNFAETPQSWAAKKGVDPTPVTPGMFGYSLLRANANREYSNALMDKLLLFRVPIEGLHTETGPGVYEAALVYSAALEAADGIGEGALHAAALIDRHDDVVLAMDQEDRRIGSLCLSGRRENWRSNRLNQRK